MAEIAAEGTTCSSCGRGNRPGRKFCAQCGAALALSCAACGAANEPDERFCGECGHRLDGAAALLREAQAPGAGVERRVVSVLFADLVGFTSLAEGRDAEEVRELLSRYFEIARAVVERYGGTVEKFIGDAVMAVWGTPIAQEDDAERAVRAALDLVAAVTALGSELEASELAARAGVLSGEAAVTLGAEGQGMVAGDLVNSASRVQAIAEPGTVVVGETTRRASDAAIAYSDAGVHELKGREDAMQLWRALRVTAGRAGSLKWEGIEPPFVGRERELRLVKELFHASADERKAHLVTVVGIAGIGKSRLAWELYKYVDGVEQTVRWHQGRCLAYGDGVAYSALAEMVRMRAEIVEGEEHASARAKLRETLALHIEDPGERSWIEPRLAQLLALDEPETGELSDLFAGWRLFFERIAEREPVVLVFEDMQWADGPLLDFLDHLLEWSRNHAIFVLSLARPELADRHPQWALAKRNSTTLSLEPLSRAAMEKLLDGFVPGLPEELRRRVLDSSEGVPLYAVETVRMLLDRGLLEQHGDEFRVIGPVDSLDVPETLHALIAARLDGLSAGERRALQQAAVLGKTFTKRALAAVAGGNGPALDRLLEALVRKEILSLQADPRSPERGQYGFLQDLLRQVAYETLPRRERKGLHLAAAAYLEQEWLDGDEDVVEIVASHYLSALELDPGGSDAADIRANAVDTLTRAGERASSLAANEAAQRYFEGALERADDGARQAELHEQAGRMAMLRGRTSEARSHFERAIALYDLIGRPLAGVRVTAKLGQLTWTQEGEIERAVVDMGRAFEVLAEEERSLELAMLAAQLARVLFFSGRSDEAMARNELALEMAEALELPEVLSQAFTTKSVILDGLGRHREAQLLLRYALELALANDLSEAALRAYNNLAGEAETRDRSREALDHLHAMSQLAQRVGDRESGRLAAASTIRLLIDRGEWDRALDLAEERSRTDEDDSPKTRADLAVEPLYILLQRGELEEARRRWEAWAAFVDQSDVQARAGHRFYEALLLLAESRPAEAIAPAEEVLASSLGIGHWTTKAGLEAGLEAAAALGDAEKLDDLLSLIESAPPGHVSPYVRALGARFGALRAARQGECGTVHAGFEAAADLLREIEKPFQLAVVLLEHAEWLASAGRAEEAAALAGEARETFERLRAMPWLQRLDRLPSPVAEHVAAE
jgi:class 3 adenylate cyclase/tetratricopeptide (TPR) repeat protein